MAGHCCEHCSKCLVLCSHEIMQEQACEPSMRVCLHQDPGQGNTAHILVQQLLPVKWEVVLRLGQRPTEYIADFYTSVVKALEAQMKGRLLRAGAAPANAKVRLTGKKANTSIDVLAQYFHLPISEASKQVNICTTAVKRICRRHGLARWPHRKVKSVDQKVAKARVVWIGNNS